MVVTEQIQELSFCNCLVWVHAEPLVGFAVKKSAFICTCTYTINVHVCVCHLYVCVLCSCVHPWSGSLRVAHLIGKCAHSGMTVPYITTNPCRCLSIFWEALVSSPLNPRLVWRLTSSVPLVQCQPRGCARSLTREPGSTSCWPGSTPSSRRGSAMLHSDGLRSTSSMSLTSEWAVIHWTLGWRLWHR